MDKATYTFGSNSFQFNDFVIAECIRLPEENRKGRLVQVRIGTGAFGTDKYIIRLLNGSLQQVENVLLLPYKEELDIEPEEPDYEYSIQHQFPETGFIIEHPSEPHSPHQSFAMTVVG